MDFSAIYKPRPAYERICHKYPQAILSDLLHAFAITVRYYAPPASFCIQYVKAYAYRCKDICIIVQEAES